MNSETKKTLWSFVSQFAITTILMTAAYTLQGTFAPASAAALEGTKTIFLIDADGKEHQIGNVTFAAADGATSMKVKIDENRFVEKFLSMRPFRCIDGPKQTVCYLPYPYELKKRISKGDLADLEYSLLFLHKGPTDYGIDAWNGLYYKLEMTDKGEFNGTLQEADFNVLAVPPDVKFSRPIGAVDLTPAEEGRHRFPGLSIR